MNKRSEFRSRVEWLVTHAGEWYKPGEEYQRTRGLIEGMQAAGLISRKTNWFDVRATREIVAAQMILRGRDGSRSQS
jgi:hypothetical protein